MRAEGETGGSLRKAQPVGAAASTRNPSNVDTIIAPSATRILASVDLHPDTFQPNVSVQTSLLVLERKTDEEIRLEKAAGRKADYNVFMAVANHVGHDKRGNKTYVRDKLGNEIVVEADETVKEYEGGKPVYRRLKSLQKVVDDNTLQIAKAFREWLAAQD